MVVLDLNSKTVEVSSEPELESVLKGRYEANVNEFWLNDPGVEYPTLSILVKEQFAALHYFPMAGIAGFKSQGGKGSIRGIDPGGSTSFPIGGGADVATVLNDTLVPFSAALQAAKEFLRSRALPPSIDWLEL